MKFALLISLVAVSSVACKDRAFDSTTSAARSSDVRTLDQAPLLDCESSDRDWNLRLRHISENGAESLRILFEPAGDFNRSQQTVVFAIPATRDSTKLVPVFVTSGKFSKLAGGTGPKFFDEKDMETTETLYSKLVGLKNIEGISFDFRQPDRGGHPLEFNINIEYKSGSALKKFTSLPLRCQKNSLIHFEPKIPVQVIEK
jgi:hypothetical protein